MLECNVVKQQQDAQTTAGLHQNSVFFSYSTIFVKELYTPVDVNGVCF